MEVKKITGIALINRTDNLLEATNDEVKAVLSIVTLEGINNLFIVSIKTSITYMGVSEYKKEYVLRLPMGATPTRQQLVELNIFSDIHALYQTTNVPQYVLSEIANMFDQSSMMFLNIEDSSFDIDLLIEHTDRMDDFITNKRITKINLVSSPGRLSLFRPFKPEYINMIEGDYDRMAESNKLIKYIELDTIDETSTTTEVVLELFSLM